jgi:hypothetical protein
MTNRSNRKLRSSGVAAPTAVFVGAACALVLCTHIADAATPEKAKQMFDAIAGVPPSDAQLNQMIAAGDDVTAALVATEDPAFYSVTLKNFVTPWTNRDQTVFAPLNDYTATVIGMVRDNVPFNTALSSDLIYVVNGNGLPAVSATNNDHYAQAETNNIDLKQALQPAQQSQVYGIPAAATAGLLTTRAASAAFFIDGTNRAMFRFTMVNHMCKDMEQLQDTSRAPDRIRQDVSRSPGGDSRLFLNGCIGCHSGMDPMAQAFAFYDFDETQGTDLPMGEQRGRLVYTPNVVNPKYFINSDNFKPGFVTPDDSWVNRWRAGQNAPVLNFSPSLPGNGAGAKSLGDEIANSGQFAQCQVEKVFKAVCFRAPSTQADFNSVTAITGNFVTGGYRLKNVFAETAAYCKN